MMSNTVIISDTQLGDFCTSVALYGDSEVRIYHKCTGYM